MDVKDVLITANRAVQEAELPEDLKDTAFAKAVDLIAGTGQVARPSSAVVSTPTRSADIFGQPTVDDGGTLGRIAAKLRVDIDTVRELYNEEDGKLEVTVPSAKLETSKKGATKQLALLVAAGRQAAGLEEYTPLERVREVAELFRRYDSPNFARTIQEMEEDFSFRGESRSRAIRVSRPGWEHVTRLIGELEGIDS